LVTLFEVSLFGRRLLALCLGWHRPHRLFQNLSKQSLFTCLEVCLLSLYSLAYHPVTTSSESNRSLVLSFFPLSPLPAILGVPLVAPYFVPRSAFFLFLNFWFDNCSFKPAINRPLSSLCAPRRQKYSSERRVVLTRGDDLCLVFISVILPFLYR